jgi:hypothetical protein
LLSDSRIHPNRVRAAGYGERRPIATNKTDAGRAENRRTVAELDIEFGLPVDGNGKAETVVDGEVPLNIIDPATIPPPYVKPAPPPVPKSVTTDKPSAAAAAKKERTLEDVRDEFKRYQEELEKNMTPAQREASAKLRKAIEDARKRAAEREKQP